MSCSCLRFKSRAMDACLTWSGNSNFGTTQVQEREGLQHRGIKSHAPHLLQIWVVKHLCLSCEIKWCNSHLFNDFGAEGHPRLERVNVNLSRLSWLRILQSCTIFIIKIQGFRTRSAKEKVIRFSLHLKSQALKSSCHPKVHTPPQPSTLNPQPSTLNPQPSTLNPHPSTLNPQPSTLNPQPSTLNRSKHKQS